MMEAEIWKDILGYEGKYQVSNLGNVRSLSYLGSPGRVELLKPKFSTTDPNVIPHLKVQLCKNGKTKYKYIHQLVAQAFIPNSENLIKVNHMDENPMNNIWTNLEWCTDQYNCNYGTRNARMAKANTNNPNFSKPVICIELNKVFPSAREVTRQLGIDFATICNCCRHTQSYHTAGGYHWEYYTLDFDITKYRPIAKKTERAVKCIETGIVYSSLAAAGRSVNVGTSAIRQVCTGISKTSGGYHWEYVD